MCTEWHVLHWKLYVNLKSYNSWFATTWQGGHVGGQYNRIFSRRIYMKIEFSSQRREMLLFLTTNMAAVTSRANQQYRQHQLLEHYSWVSKGLKWTSRVKLSAFTQIAATWFVAREVSLLHLWLLITNAFYQFGSIKYFSYMPDKLSNLNSF